MSTWESVKLAECVDLLAGFAFKSQRFTANPRDIALVKGENVSQGAILWDIAKRWPVAEWEDLEKFRLLPGDVVVAMDRPWVPAGLKWAFIRKTDPVALLVQRCARLRPKNGNLDQGFLRFIIGGPCFENYVKPITTGVNVPHISGHQILSFRFELPPLTVQRRIVSVLSAFDELIENDQRRIRILEELIHRLYREWFVHFRVPGHENYRLVSSYLGAIPSGWKVSEVGNVTTKIGSGATPRGGKESYEKQGISLIRSLNIYDYHFEMSDLAFINEKQAAQLGNVAVEPLDVLLNITGASVARCSMVPPSLLPARVNQHVAIIRANPSQIDPYFLLDTINSDYNKQRLMSIAQGGATREALTKDAISGFPILLPPFDVIQRYGKIAGKLHTLRETLRLQVESLRHTRNLLLPRLLSGQIELEAN